MNSKKSALFVATLGSFLTPFMSSSVNIALPSIGKEFAMNAILLSWVNTAYLLAAAVFLVPFGRVADIYGRKKVFSYGIIVYTLSSFLLGVSPSGFFLLVFRVLQGMGGAMIFGTAVAILTSVFPVSERGKVIGINIAAVYTGLSLGPVLGGFLTQYLGWRSIFLVNVPLGLAVIVLVIARLPGEWAGSPGEKFDIPGSLVYGLTLVTIIYGMSLLPEKEALYLISIGILGIFAFVKWETRIDAPVLNMNLFKRNVVFAFSSLAALINYSATFAVAFLMSLYLQYIRGFDPQNAGLILLCQPVVMVLFSPFAGRLSDKIEPRIVASFGMALTTAALFTFALLEDTTGIQFVIARLAFLGAGLAFFSSPNTNAIMSSVGKKSYGIGSAMVATMRLLGQMTSMGIAMVVIALYIGKVEITPEYYVMFLKSAKLIFTIFAGLCFGGVFASLARGKIR
ncbi:MAG: MFS transporter [Theionarchaea archaeon DG-70]|nr:MAG: MFS transporter [Theionarchaea archaeon DG-70]